jgi:hypothetical protein
VRLLVSGPLTLVVGGVKSLVGRLERDGIDPNDEGVAIMAATHLN